jgi:ketosteroid isomerase-like protein
MGTLENRAIAERHWQLMYAKDWETLATQFAPDAEYTDIGAVPPAIGPRAIADRLKLGLGPTAKMVHRPGVVLAEGDIVITEHIEEWHFHTGEVIAHPFCSVMEIRDGKIVRWHDYSHLNNLLDNAPRWWIEHIMSGGTTPIP